MKRPFDERDWYHDVETARSREQMARVIARHLRGPWYSIIGIRSERAKALLALKALEGSGELDVVLDAVDALSAVHDKLLVLAQTWPGGLLESSALVDRTRRAFTMTVLVLLEAPEVEEETEIEAGSLELLPETMAVTP